MHPKNNPPDFLLCSLRSLWLECLSFPPVRPSVRLAPLYLVAFFPFLLSSCASGSGDDSPFDKVITRDTDMTRSGSAESETLRHLEPGTRLRIIGMSGDGRLEVETVSGDKGFVNRNTVGDEAPYDPNHPN